MSRIVTSFDPSATTQGAFTANILVNESSLLILNESSYFLKLDLGTSGGQIIIQPWVNRLIRGVDRLQDVSWYQAGSISPASAPISITYVIAFDPAEEVSDSWNMPLQRITNVGNTVSVTGNTSTTDLEFVAPFVSLGLTPVRDGSVANQLDVLAGVAFLLNAAGALVQVTTAATSFQTSVANVTYFLDLNPDGTWSWGTSHSAQANYLSVASVTSDGSANIGAVTDTRTLTASLLTGAPAILGAGGLEEPAPLNLLTTQAPAKAGVVAGGVTFGQAGLVPASSATAALFNGVSGYIAASYGSDLPTSAQPFTLEGIIEIAAYPAATSDFYALGNRDIVGNSAYLQLTSTGHVNFVTIGGAPIASNTPLALNARHHIAATYDGVTMRLYIDGIVQAATQTATLTLSYVGDFPYVIGATSSGTSHAAPVGFYGGVMAHVALYQVALSATQITNHYNALIAQTVDAYAATVLADNPSRYYRLDDAAGSATAACASQTAAATVFDAGGTLRSVGGQKTAGAYGAPLVIARAHSVQVTTNATTGILIATLPDGAPRIVRLWVQFIVGANTNNGLITILAVGTLPLGGSVVEAFSDPNSAAAQYNNVTRVKNNYYFTMPLMLELQGGTTISVEYLNSAAGTISDFVTAIIELLA